jgi:hypothetical protein
MKKDRIVLDFIKKPVPSKIEFSRNVFTRMSGNPNFLHPDVSLEELAAKITLLETRSVAALNGGKEAKALMHQTEEELDDFLRKEAGYVDRTADGDDAIILSSGFNLAKQPASAVRPEFSIELGEKFGSVSIRRQAVAGAKSYIWQFCIGEMPAANDADWVTAQVTSKATVELTGLTPLTKYWFRSAAVLISGTTAYNPPVMQVVI